MTENRPTILIVDDEREILIALEDLFDEEYRVLAFSSPVVALDAIDAHPEIAVIVSDQRMPDMPGHVFLGRARAKSRAETLLLTGYADLSAVVSAVNMGGIGGYAQKPWQEQALRAMVAAAAERYRLRQELAFERAIFMAISERSADRIAVVDAGGRTVRVNRGEAGGVDPEDAAALATGVVGDREERVTGDDGVARWLRTQRIPFVAEGSPPHLLRIESDQSAQRLIEQKLHQSEKLQALGTLAGGIAHDFNNLLAAIIGNLELAGRRTGDDPRLAKFVGNAARAAERGTALSQRLLSFSRQRDLAAEIFDPNESVIASEDLIVRSTAGLVRLRFDLGAGVWPVKVDRGQFELALLNLCINARDAMARGGEIVIATRNVAAGSADAPAGTVDDRVAISVTDSGTGMSAQVLARAFEPFFTTKEPGHGTGLGLPMVHAMAEAAGGTATVASTIGVGTTVSVWLPRAAAAAAAAVPAEAPAIAPVTGLRVLVVEDDAAVRAIAVAHLDALGHITTQVASAEDAIALIEQDAGFDLIVTDHAMPGMSGCELADVARVRWPWVRVLLVTGFADVATRPAAIAVLTKPFTRDGLAAAVARAMAASEPDR